MSATSGVASSDETWGLTPGSVTGVVCVNDLWGCEHGRTATSGGVSSLGSSGDSLEEGEVIPEGRKSASVTSVDRGYGGRFFKSISLCQRVSRRSGVCCNEASTPDGLAPLLKFSRPCDACCDAEQVQQQCRSALLRTLCTREQDQHHRPCSPKPNVSRQKRQMPFSQCWCGRRDHWP